MKKKSYHGYANGDVVVWDGFGGCRLLPPGLDLRNHSPAGFNWGYGGSGPAQLALAIMADLLGREDPKVMACYHCFKREVIALLPSAEVWTLSEEDVRNWLYAWESECFDTAWEYLADEGRVDDEGSEQYRRVKSVWRATGATIDDLFFVWLLEEGAKDTFTQII